MDYRKPGVFGENWHPSRYKVIPYFAAEKEVLKKEGVKKVLDIGCGSGWNMSRFLQYGGDYITFGLDVVTERVAYAKRFGPVMMASGLTLPFPDDTFDVIYIQHVLHHIGDVEQALREVRRCLKEDGVFFLIETVEDNPIIRWGRTIYPKWLDDDVNARFYFGALQDDVQAQGFKVMKAQQYSVLFWIWEIFPDQLPFMEKLTPLFVKGEQLLVRFLRPYAAHCFLIAEY